MIWACRQITDMPTIHQRQAGNAHQASNPQEASATSGDVAFSVEPASDCEREAQEIHATLQRCQGMIGAHEITSWRNQITVRKLSPHTPAVHDACLVHQPLQPSSCMLSPHAGYTQHEILYSIPMLRNVFSSQDRSAQMPLSNICLCFWVQTRSVVLGAIYGAVFSIIVHKLNLTTGVIPSLGMSIALIDFFTVKLWNGMLAKMNFGVFPFTPQVSSLALSCHPACTSQDPTYALLQTSSTVVASSCRLRGKPEGLCNTCKCALRCSHHNM